MKPQIEAVLAEEQAGFRAGRSTVEQICNCRILCEEYRDHRLEVHHNFVDFKIAFDRVWREAMWATMQKHTISPKVIQICDLLYSNASNAVMWNNKTLAWLQNKCRSKTRVHPITKSIQLVPRANHVRCARRFQWLGESWRKGSWRSQICR